MKYKVFRKEAHLSEIEIVNDEYDPGEVYLFVLFKENIDKKSARDLIEDLNRLGIKSYLQTSITGQNKKENQRISVPAHKCAIFLDYLRDNSYISNADRADLATLTRRVETILFERSKVSASSSNSQSEVIQEFIKPYLEGILNNLNLNDSLKLIGLALGRWNFDPTKGSHASEWKHNIKMRENMDLSKNFDEEAIEDICMTMTIISALCSGKAYLNQTMLKLGENLPGPEAIKEMVKQSCIEEINNHYTDKEKFTGWEEHFDRYCEGAFLMQGYRKRNLNNEISIFKKDNLKPVTDTPVNHDKKPTTR